MQADPTVIDAGYSVNGQEVVDLPAEDEIAAIQAEVESMPIGEFASSDDERTLHRYLARRVAIMDEIKRIKENTASMVRSMESQLHSLEYVYGCAVRQIASKLIADRGGRVKSIKTPWGKVGFRTRPAQLVVEDIEMVFAAIDEGQLPQAARRIQQKTTVDVNLEYLRQFFRTSGEVPPGCEVESEFESFYVTQ